MSARRAAVAVGVAAAVVLSACDGAGPRESPEPSENLNVEGARAFVLAEIFRFYGKAADPFIARLASERRVVDGRPALRLEVTVRFTAGGRQAMDGWIFWVGFRDGEAGVLRSEGPRPADPAEG